MLQNIRIKNYKKFTGDDFHEFSFTSGLNVIIGENNAGKTTLLNLIRAFFENDSKFFKPLADMNLQNDAKPIIEIQYDDIWYSLRTSGKVWKFDMDEHVGFSYGFISANSSISEIEEALSNVYLSYIESNRGLRAKIEEIKESFKNDLNLAFAHTTTIAEDGDDFQPTLLSDFKKAFKVEFTSTNPLSISNKGLGQQKEFLINYFVEKNTIKMTDILLIDEVENSLSIKSLEEILNRIKLNHGNKQFIFSTHSASTVGDGIGVNVVTVGSEIPVRVVAMVRNLVICEGFNDMKVFQNFWGNTHSFLFAGGSTIVEQCRNLRASGLPFKVVVDGDFAGLGYVAGIRALDPTIPVHHLIDGCTEDYLNLTVISNAYASIGLVAPIPKIKDILHNQPITNANRLAFKEKLNKSPTRDYDEPKLRNELDTFLA